MPKRVRDQVVVIIGASSGLGRQTACELADRGATVVVSSRRQEALESLAAELDKRGARAVLALACDVTDEDSVEHLMRATVERFGRLDTLMVMPAVNVYAPVEHTTMGEYERVLDVNFLGYVRAAKAALAIFRRQKSGTLINIASGLTGAGLPLQSAYASAAQSIIGFTRTLREELYGTNIEISLVLAGSMATPLATNHARSKTGRTPRSVPPVSHPKTVAKQLVKCAERPRALIKANVAAKAFYPAAQLAPGLVGRLMSTIGRSLQMTREPRAVRGQDNLDQPSRRRGRILGPQRPTLEKLRRWAAAHPGRAALGAALAAAAFFAASRGLGRLMRG